MHNSSGPSKSWHWGGKASYNGLGVVEVGKSVGT